MRLALQLWRLGEPTFPAFCLQDTAGCLPQHLVQTNNPASCSGLIKPAASRPSSTCDLVDLSICHLCALLLSHYFFILLQETSVGTFMWSISNLCTHDFKVMFVTMHWWNRINPLVKQLKLASTAGTGLAWKYRENNKAFMLVQIFSLSLAASLLNVSTISDPFHQTVQS